MKINKVQGVVLKEINTGEADKIVTILTKRLGKIQALAKGARRPKSTLIAETQFLCFSDFVLFKANDMYDVRSCELIESFYNIRTDMEKLTYASHLVELVNEVSDENMSCQKLLQLLLNTLHMLANSDKPQDLIAIIFEIRLMSIIGFTPQIIECTECKTVSSENMLFSSKLGGIICKECISKDKTAISISAGTLSALRYIVYSDMKKIFSFDVSDSVLCELKAVSSQFLLTHLNKKFSKLEFLDTLNKG